MFDNCYDDEMTVLMISLVRKKIDEPGRMIYVMDGAWLEQKKEVSVKRGVQV